jgi:hypothetical protein
VDVSGSVVLISGIIDGKVEIEAEEVYIGYPAQIAGDLIYTSRLEAEIEEDVLVGGEIIHELPEDKEELESLFPAIMPILRFLLFVMALITGYAMILLFNRHTREAAEQMETRFWPTFAAGLLTMILIVMGAIIMTALVVGIPLAIIMTSLGILLFYIGKIYVSIVIGRLVFKIFSSTKKFALGWEFLVGLIILTLVFRIPVVGTLVYILSFIIGAGAAVMGYLSLNKKLTSALKPQTAPAPPPEAE